MRHFTYKNLDEIRRAAQERGARHVRFEEDPGKVRQTLARPVRVGGWTAGNSIAIHPMEGCDGTPDGRPGELTFRRYQRFARGGAKLIWFEATAICPEGRANPRQLWITPENVTDFARLLEMLRRTHREFWGTAGDLLIPVQLTHSGRYSTPRRIIAYHNPLIDAKTQIPPDYPVITDGELEALEDRYVEAVRLAVAAGFDAVDIKAVHGYLISELLGAKVRPGRYGGPLENRVRMLRNILGKLRAEFGNRVLIGMRMNAFDGIPYRRDPATGIGVPLEYSIPYLHGFGVDPQDPLREDLSEVKQVIGWLRQDGLELLNLSLGSPYYNPHIGRPFEKPDEGNYEQPEHPLLGVERHFRIAAELQRTFPDLPMVGTGYSWLQHFAIHAAAHNLSSGAIRFFGMGRNALAYPEFPKDALEKGALDERKVCKTLTYCTYLMRQKFPTGCPPFDKEGYGAVIKAARQSAHDQPDSRTRS